MVWDLKDQKELKENMKLHVYWNSRGGGGYVYIVWINDFSERCN